MRFEPALTRFVRFLVMQPNGCVTFTGGKCRGYGQFWDGEKTITAHRFGYQLLHGPVPDGLTLDHECHDRKTCAGGPTCPHRACVVHAVPRGRGANAARGLTLTDTCKAGLHPWTEDNIIRRPSRPSGECRACCNARRREAGRV